MADEEMKACGDREDNCDLRESSGGGAFVPGSDTVMLCVYIMRVKHKGRQDLGVFPDIQQGVWRISDKATTSLGAHVLLAEHEESKDHPHCYYKTDEEQNLGQEPHHHSPLVHPYLLTLYGAHDTLFVCEDGSRFCTFFETAVNRKYLMRVLRDVLQGMQYIHELGFVHGCVDINHIVVGPNNRGKLLLTHFLKNGHQQQIREPEPEKGPKGSEPNDPDFGDTDAGSPVCADEVSLLKCMQFAMEKFRVFTNECEDPKKHERVVKYFAFAQATLDRLDKMLLDRSKHTPPPLQERHAIFKRMERLAKLEAGAFGSRAPVPVAVQ